MRFPRVCMLWAFHTLAKRSLNPVYVEDGEGGHTRAHTCVHACHWRGFAAEEIGSGAAISEVRVWLRPDYASSASIVGGLQVRIPPAPILFPFRTAKVGHKAGSAEMLEYKGKRGNPTEGNLWEVVEKGLGAQQIEVSEQDDREHFASESFLGLWT